MSLIEIPKKVTLAQDGVDYSNYVNPDNVAYFKPGMPATMTDMVFTSGTTMKVTMAVDELAEIMNGGEKPPRFIKLGDTYIQPSAVTVLGADDRNPKKWTTIGFNGKAFTHVDMPVSEVVSAYNEAERLRGLIR